MRSVVLVSGDFTPWGGMDRANYELAWHLADRAGVAVHLVSHRVVAPLAEHPAVTWHRVPRPLGRHLLGGAWLAARGRRIARRLAADGARVIVNGGNCAWPDVNWVHAVQAAWGLRHAHAPPAFRLRAAWAKRAARRSERRALSAAGLVVTNSRRARAHVIDLVRIPPERVHAVYYGNDATVFAPVTPGARAAAGAALGIVDDRPVVAFVGALGHDRNKGFDVLFAAWQVLARDAGWLGELLVAGPGREVPLWRARAAAAGLGDRVRFLGFVHDVPAILRAADALVSPTHYDAYGLAVQEALCLGLPAFVTRTAGVAERYPADLGDLLLDDPPSADDIVHRLRRWADARPEYTARVAPFGESLRRRTWTDMAQDIVTLVEAQSRR